MQLQPVYIQCKTAVDVVQPMLGRLTEFAVGEELQHVTALARALAEWELECISAETIHAVYQCLRKS